MGAIGDRAAPHPGCCCCCCFAANATGAILSPSVDRASCWIELGPDSCGRRRRRYTTPTAAVAAAGTGLVLELVRLECSERSSGDRRAAVPCSGTIHAKSALASGRPSPGHQEGSGDCRARLATTVRRRRRHTEVGQATWRCVASTLPYQHRRLDDHSLTNWKPLKCRARGSAWCVHDDERRRPDEPPHSVPTGGDGDGRRQEVSCSSSPAGNSQMLRPEHASPRASAIDG